MTATDRLRQAAQELRDRPLTSGFDRVSLAVVIADWLEDIAADKDSGLGTIHPRALDVTNLILGSDQ